MIYTLGHAESYLKYIKEYGENARKLGRNDSESYCGGSVWKTFEGANKYLKNGFDPLGEHSVFGVLADWEKDTAKNKDVDWNDLLVSSQIIKLDEQGEI